MLQAAMDAVNVDLDEMRARVDSTHSIITSRQRVEATLYNFDPRGKTMTTAFFN